MPVIREEDYGEDYANHPSIKAIHEHRGSSAPACFSFRRASETQVELLLKEINVRKSPGHDMIPPKLIREAAAVIARPMTSIINCWFSHDVTKMQTKKLSILPRFYFHDALEQLKTNFHTNFRFKRILGFVVEYA